jgi:integrase
VGFRRARHERLLGDFARFSRERRDNTVTIWEPSPGRRSLKCQSGLDSGTIARRASVRQVAGGARNRTTKSRRPGSSALGLAARPRSSIPKPISSPCSAQPDAKPTRSEPPPLESFICLLVVTGMRASEAMALDAADIDWQHCPLTLRSTKLNKTPLMPLHAATRDTLHAHTQVSDRLRGRPSSPALFIRSSGSRVSRSVIQPAPAAAGRGQHRGERTAAAPPAQPTTFLCGALPAPLRRPPLPRTR